MDPDAEAVDEDAGNGPNNEVAFGAIIKDVILGVVGVAPALEDNAFVDGSPKIRSSKNELDMIEVFGGKAGAAGTLRK